jgi:hypothetical protein
MSFVPCAWCAGHQRKETQMGKKKIDVVAAEALATETKTKKTPTLLWNERGQIGCTIPGHAPHKGTDTWKFEHWKKIPGGTVKEDGSAYVCETCAQTDRVPVEPPAEDPKPKKKVKTDATLADLSDRYLRHMENAGKSNGTCFSYKLELATAMNALGADTKLADLTPEMVALFFGSERVNRKKNGKEKSPLSIAKTQRVLRLALVWAESAKLVAKAPLPEDLATH